MPAVTPSGHWWMVDLTQPFRSIEFVHFESGAIYGDFAQLKLFIQPLGVVRGKIDMSPEDAEDKHLHECYELADQCIQAARDNFKLSEFVLTINFGNNGYLGISATLELTVTAKGEKP